MGVWPYERSKLARFRLILFFGILTSFLILQFTTFFTLEHSVDLIIKIVSFLCFFICLIIKYNSFWINANVVKQSLDRLQHICNEIKTDKEITILEEYGYIGKRYTIILILLCIITSPVILVPPIWPCILDIVFPINESRPHPSLHVVTEYFIDQKKYFYLIMLHRNAALYIGIGAILSTGTFFLIYFQYICGILSIVSLRIKNAMSNFHKASQEKQLYKELTYAIYIHRIATECCVFLMSNFEGSFFFLIIMGVISLSSSLVLIASSINDIEEILLSFIVLLVLYIYLFLANYNAQTITDHNELVFATVYSVQWYIAPLRVQKMILFLLQKGTKAFTLNLGGIFIASLESAAMVTSTSISYFTVLYSTRQN